MEKRKNPLNPRHAWVNSISNVNPTPLSESPLRENAETFQKYARPYPLLKTSARNLKLE
jgi:hypothetical protein